MGTRKIFKKTDLSIPAIQHTRGENGSIDISDDAIPPKDTVVKFPHNSCTNRTFDFSTWYGTGIDQITYAMQRQIERFLAHCDADLSIATIANCCINGVRQFLKYM